MLASCDLVAFVPTVDPDRARSFYHETLGLPLVSESPVASVFQARNALLRVTAVERIEHRPYTVVGWHVADIAAAIRSLAGRGVTFARYEGIEQDDLGVWRAPDGTRIAWFLDPDGNTLSLTQP